MIQTKQPPQTVQMTYTKKDSSHPIEHANPNRHGTRPAHPLAYMGDAVHTRVFAPRTSAWRQAESRSPDTHLPGYGNPFSNGDRRHAAGRSEVRSH